MRVNQRGIPMKIIEKCKNVVKSAALMRNLPSIVLHKSADKEKFNLLTKAFKKHAKAYGLETPIVKAHFWAQMAHETGGFRWYRELGGKSYFKRYEGRRDLGNVIQGDGYKFRGRGIIHLTGRYNYKKYGRKLGINLIKNPELAETPEVAIKVALTYWQDRGITPLAQEDNIRAVTRRINGGLNGLADRRRYLRKLKAHI